MPYADHLARKRVQRESAARRRTAAREAANRSGLMSTPVNPALAPFVSPLPRPSAADIDFAARLLNVEPLRGDTPESLHQRVKTVWDRLMQVVEG